MAIKVEERELSLVERLYIREVAMGLALTMGHFVRNLSVHIANLFGLAKGKRGAETYQYPEERRPLAPRLRTARAVPAYQGACLPGSRTKTPGCPCPSGWHLQDKLPHNIHKRRTGPGRCRTEPGISRSADWDARRHSSSSASDRQTQRQTARGRYRERA